MGAVLRSDHQTNFSTFWMLHVPLVKEGGAPQNAAHRSQVLVRRWDGKERGGRGLCLRIEHPGRETEGKGGRAMVLSDQRQADLHEGHAAYLDCASRTLLLGRAGGSGRVRVRAARFCAAGEKTGRRGIHRNPPWLCLSHGRRTKERITSEQESEQRHIYIVGVLQDMCL
jgi:hypothetical protein